MSTSLIQAPTHRRSRAGVVAVLVAILAAVAAVLAVPTAASAAVRVPPGCGQPSVSSTGHTLTMHCSSGHGSRYKVVANACDSHHCIAVGSNVVKYGTTARVDSGAYLSSSGLRVYWYPATGSTACAYTAPGGTVPWCDMAQSINDWAAKRPSYDGSYTSNWYKDKSYRADCSGLVSMVWHLTSIPDTDALATSTYTTAISKASLRPGDILDDIEGSHDNHHVIIFAGWNADHHAGTTDGTFKIWSFGYGTFANDSGHHELHDSFRSGTQIAFKPQGDYIARRYVHGAP